MQRVLDALWRARHVDRENGGWMYAFDLWKEKKIEPNRLGLRMGLALIQITLWRLEEQDLVEWEWKDQPPFSRFSRRLAYRITEHGDRERASNPVRARRSLLGKLRPGTDND